MTTYSFGLLQTKAYRELKNYAAKALEKFNITSVEWAYLGLLYDKKNGLRFTEVASELGVEAPFVTAMYKRFEKRGLVEMAVDENDNRAKIMKLSREGKLFVEKVEAYLKKEVRNIINGISLKDIATYIKVMEAFLKGLEAKRREFQ